MVTFTVKVRIDFYQNKVNHIKTSGKHTFQSSWKAVISHSYQARAAFSHHVAGNARIWICSG